MKYFLIKTHTAYTCAPDIINWFFAFDKKRIHPAESYHLPDRTLLEIRSQDDTVFTDIISSPYLLVSRLVKKVIQLYHPKMIFKEIILANARKNLVEVYYLPVLPVVSCLHASSECSVDRSVLKRGVLDISTLGDDKIFRIGDVKNQYYAVALDLAESILRRGARGIELKPLELYPCEDIYEMEGDQRERRVEFAEGD